jgi:hypothetical protein
MMFCIEATIDKGGALRGAPETPMESLLLCLPRNNKKASLLHEGRHALQPAMILD